MIRWFKHLFRHEIDERRGYGSSSEEHCAYCDKWFVRWFGVKL